jgi:hypothetical protein
MSEKLNPNPIPIYCDVCRNIGAGLIEAKYDAKLSTGPWVYVCEEHFKKNTALISAWEKVAN